MEHGKRNVKWTELDEMVVRFIRSCWSGANVSKLIATVNYTR